LSFPSWLVMGHANGYLVDGASVSARDTRDIGLADDFDPCPRPNGRGLRHSVTVIPHSRCCGRPKPGSTPHRFLLTFQLEQLQAIHNREGGPVGQDRWLEPLGHPSYGRSDALSKGGRPRKSNLSLECCPVHGY